MKAIIFIIILGFSNFVFAEVQSKDLVLSPSDSSRFFQLLEEFITMGDASLEKKITLNRLVCTATSDFDGIFTDCEVDFDQRGRAIFGGKMAERLHDRLISLGALELNYFGSTVELENFVCETEVKSSMMDAAVTESSCKGKSIMRLPQ